MARKFVVATATLNCQYGEKTCELKPYEDRHISACRKNFANEGDMSGENVEGFGTCRSPYRGNFPKEALEKINHIQALLANVSMPSCAYRSEIAWQNSNETVRIGAEGYRALMEDGWTMCSNGLGLITLVDTGQVEEDKIQEMLEKLEELEKVIDKYMKENGIEEKHRDELMKSVLLWNAYPADAITWGYESNKINRNFCAYLQEENPALANYFERGLYIQDNGGETIDVSYMLGTYTAFNQNREPWECICESMIEDRGMYNGYLEACCQEPGKGTGEMLKDFLEECQSSDYDGNSRYSSYADADMREKFGWDHPAMEGVSEEELNWQITKELISDYQQTRIEQGVQTEDYTESFINQLKADIARGE